MMDTPDPGAGRSPRHILRSVIELCADCDTCRTIMDVDCAFFPELYRLWDREKEGGIPIAEPDLRRLTELCTLCGLCPCPKIPVEVMTAKSLYVKQEGLPWATRLITDVPRLAKLCGTFPRLTQNLQSSRAFGHLLRKATRIHPERQLPSFAGENFFQWAARQGLTSRQEGSRNVAYFAGCTAGYLFPEVGRSVVEVLRRNGIQIYVPPQQCCGMPHMVEGERERTLQRASANMGRLLAAAEGGDDLVTSCPTCGYFLKVLMKERACYSEAYQQSVGAGFDELKVPEPASGGRQHKVLKKSMYKDILKDDGYFSSLDPMARIGLAEKLSDMGEYLGRMHAEGQFDTRFHAVPKHMVYFAPCHQREQKMGRPYLPLLAQIPGLTIEPVGETECCGMGGNFGYKADFHSTSLALGEPLLNKIRDKAPQAIITDCMSCRLQFHHVLPHPVFHPMEVLAAAYRAPQ
jgi:glycerol-3-phosphate dehydrogenase subunit C